MTTSDPAAPDDPGGSGEHPAATVLALSEQLLASDLDAAQRDNVEAILATAYQWLEQAREVSARASPAEAAEPFSLRDLIAFRLEPTVAEARAQGLRLSVEIDPDTPDALSGDAARLAQALAALIDWAARADEAALEIEPEFIASGVAALSFAVTLAGRHSAASAIPELAAAVRALGGSIAGGPGRLAFSARFAIASAGRAQPAGAAPQAALGGRQVVLAFDAAEKRARLAGLLCDWGLSPLEADSADMAIALLERARHGGRPVAAMLMGRWLAGMDGFLVALKVKRQAAIAATPLLMLTAQGRRGDAMRCRAYGIGAYLPEPVNPPDLREALATLLGLQGGLVDDAPTLVTRHSLREQRAGGSALLVDPDRERQAFAAHLLDAAGMSLALADDLAAARELIARQPFQAVLVATAVEDADHVVETLTAAAGAAPPPLFALAEGLGETTCMLLQHAGFTEVIGLPLKADELRAALARLHPG